MTKRIPVVKVKSDLTESGFMVINQDRFDPEQHERFEESAEVVGSIEPTGDADPSEGGDGDEGGDESGGTEDEKGDQGNEALEFVLPEGYRTAHVAGGYYHLFAPGEVHVPGPSNGKWQGESAAIEAAIAHAAG